MVHFLLLRISFIWASSPTRLKAASLVSCSLVFSLSDSSNWRSCGRAPRTQVR